jgi:hypothetical protein
MITRPSTPAAFKAAGRYSVIRPPSVPEIPAVRVRTPPPGVIERLHVAQYAAEDTVVADVEWACEVRAAETVRPKP